MTFIIWGMIAVVLGMVLYTTCLAISNEREDWYDREYGANRGEDE